MFVEKLLSTIVIISSVAYLAPFLKREKKKKKHRGSCVGTWRKKEEEVSVSEPLVWVSDDSRPGGNKRKKNVCEFVVRSVIDAYLSLRLTLQHTEKNVEERPRKRKRRQDAHLP
ncbi:transmembrane protein, putative [Medicago truncatula]|uniref:Transmembrane protein, putative n=1 Tax=Medicago truncatula TaxID=3880 RepID=G7JU65_MEDTR|nr:transmembrane protein, putative [Medicago truncatula]